MEVVVEDNRAVQAEINCLEAVKHLSKKRRTAMFEGSQP